MGLADNRYVSVTTYKRDGSAVSTPVWIAELPDGALAFTTGPDSWKVKRLRRDSRVLLRPCDMRGRVAEGAEEVAGTGEVVTDGQVLHDVQAAIARRYGIQYRLLMLGDAIKGLVGKRKPEAAVVITLTA
jgi:PPOX class probable F420-dependent enzyme